MLLFHLLFLWQSMVVCIIVDRYCITMEADVGRVVVPLANFEALQVETSFVINQPVRLY